LKWSRFGGGRVGVVPCLGWSGGSGPLMGVVGWEWSRFGGGRVGVVPFWGCPGWSGPVLGRRVGPVPFGGWSGGSAGDETDEPVLLVGTSFPLSPRVFTSFTVFWRNGGTRPVRPVDLTCIPSFLVRHHVHLLSSGRSQSPVKTRFPSKGHTRNLFLKKKMFSKKKSWTVLFFHLSQRMTEEVTNCGTRTPLMNVHSSVTGNVARKSDNLSRSSLSATYGGVL
jgi:hypothetical protein